MSKPVNSPGRKQGGADNNDEEAWCRLMRSCRSLITIRQDRKAFSAADDTPADKKEDTHRE